MLCQVSSSVKVIGSSDGEAYPVVILLLQVPTVLHSDLIEALVSCLYLTCEFDWITYVRKCKFALFSKQSARS